MSATLLAIGIVWTGVAAYRLLAKDLSGGWGNLILASVGLGFGLSTLYAAFLDKKSIVQWGVLGSLTSIFLLLALGFLSGAI